MRAILFALAVTVMIWFSMVMVHDYGQGKYLKGYAKAMENCSKERINKNP